MNEADMDNERIILWVHESPGRFHRLTFATRERDAIARWVESFDHLVLRHRFPRVCRFAYWLYNGPTSHRRMT